MNTCGTCKSCCTSLPIPELNKREGEVCKHLEKDGCGIYDVRPPVCREFECGWLASYKETAPRQSRPDRAGFIVYPQNTKFGDSLVAFLLEDKRPNKFARKHLVRVSRKTEMPILWRSPFGKKYKVENIKTQESTQ